MKFLKKNLYCTNAPTTKYNPEAGNNHCNYRLKKTT